MSLAMEETTFHVGKPLSSAQSMPDEKGRVNAIELPAQLEGAVLLNQGAPHPYPTSCESLACFVSPCFSLKEGLTEAVIKTR